MTAAKQTIMKQAHQTQHNAISYQAKLQHKLVRGSVVQYKLSQLDETSQSYSDSVSLQTYSGVTLSVALELCKI